MIPELGREARDVGWIGDASGRAGSGARRAPFGRHDVVLPLTNRMRSVSVVRTPLLDELMSVTTSGDWESRSFLRKQEQEAKPRLLKVSSRASTSKAQFLTHQTMAHKRFL